MYVASPCRTHGCFGLSKLSQLCYQNLQQLWVNFEGDYCIFISQWNKCSLSCFIWNVRKHLLLHQLVQKFSRSKSSQTYFCLRSAHGFQIERNSTFNSCKTRWLNLEDFWNRLRINLILQLRSPFIFCGCKVSHVIGQNSINTMNIPEIFSVFVVSKFECRTKKTDLKLLL